MHSGCANIERPDLGVVMQMFAYFYGGVAACGCVCLRSASVAMQIFARPDFSVAVQMIACFYPGEALGVPALYRYV